MDYSYKVVYWNEDYKVSVSFEDRKMAWAVVDKKGTILRQNDDNIAFRDFPSELAQRLPKIIKNLPVNEYEGKDVYIRFGELPESGRSTNWATGEVEPGVSAYESIYDVETGEYSTYGALPGAEIVYLIKDAPIYYITGDVAGRGSDGEPVLTNVQILGEATYNLKTGGYVSKEKNPTERSSASLSQVSKEAREASNGLADEVKAEFAHSVFPELKQER